MAESRLASAEQHIDKMTGRGYAFDGHHADAAKAYATVAQAEALERLTDALGGQEVSDVETWTSPLGTSVSWLHWGKTYSFWSHGTTTAPFEMTGEWQQWATTDDVPPLAAYKGEPMDELLYVESEEISLTPIGFLEVSSTGFRIKSMGEANIPAGAKFIANKMLILDV